MGHLQWRGGSNYLVRAFPMAASGPASRFPGAGRSARRPLGPASGDSASHRLAHADFRALADGLADPLAAIVGARSASDRPTLFYLFIYF